MEASRTSSQEAVLEKVAALDATLRTYTSSGFGAATTQTPWHEPTIRFNNPSSSSVGSNQQQALLFEQTDAAIALALSEVRTAREILQGHAVASDPAYYDYIEALRLALDAYSDDAMRAPERATALAVSLATARTNFQDNIQNLVGWLAICRAAGATAREPRVPHRFVAAPSALSHQEVSSVEMQAWSDLAMVLGE